MKTKFLNVVLLAFLAGVFLIACNEELPLVEEQVVTNSGTEQPTFQVNASITNDYLAKMIESIKNAEDKGLIKAGQAKALIAQLNAAILNTNNGNTTAAAKQLEAISTEIQELAGAGQVAMVVAEELANKAEGAAALTQGYFTDPIDNYKYPVVLIGDQIWMAENLRATMLNDGTPITNLVGDNDWFATCDDWGLGTHEPAYCWYENDFNTYGKVYGALYNFYAVNTGKLCPVGWHVPSSDEVGKLIMFLDPSAEIDLASNFGGMVTIGYSETAGSKLKEAGTLHWLDGIISTNESGFTALPGGGRIWHNFGFRQLGNYCHFYTSDCIPSTTHIDRGIQFEMDNNTSVVWILPNPFWWEVGSYDQAWEGLSVRCIKD